MNEINITKYYSNEVIIVKDHCKLDDMRGYKFITTI